MSYPTLPKDPGLIPISSIYIPGTGWAALQGVTPTTDGSGNQSAPVSAALYGKVTNPGDTPVLLDSSGRVLISLAQVAGNTVATAATGIMKVGVTDGTGTAITSTSSALDVNIKSGGGSGFSVVDEAGWTAGTSPFEPIGGVFNDSAAALTSGQQGVARLTNNRAQHANLRDASGNQLLGSKTSASSVPVVVASDQGAISTAIQVTSGTALVADQSNTELRTSLYGKSTTAGDTPVLLDSSGRPIVNINTMPAISGTVTANIGTTNGLALDASVTGLQVSQGSTTSGQKGDLVQGAVTTSAPSYTTAQTSPLSLTPAGALRVDNSANTQPVSGTVTANIQQADLSGTGTISAAQPVINTPVSNATVVLAVGQGQSVWKAQLLAGGGGFTSGTTIVADKSIDGGTTYYQASFKVSGASPATTQSSVVGPGPQELTGNAAGVTHVRIRCSVLNSTETIAVTLRSGVGVGDIGLMSSIPAGSNVIGSATIQTVSGTALAADQSNTELRSSLYVTKTTAGDTALTLGSATSANSVPVVVASDQGKLPVKAASGDFPTNSIVDLTTLITNTADLLADGDHLATIDTSTANIPAKGTAVMTGATPVTIATDDTQMTAIKNSVAAIPAKGAATVANSMPVTMASNQGSIGSVTQGAGAAAGTSWRTQGDFTETAGVGANVTGTSTDFIASTDVSAYQWFSLQFTGTWSATLQVQFSNDNVNFQALTVQAVNAGNYKVNLTANDVYTFYKVGRYMRVRCTVFTSNASLAGNLEAYTTAPAPTNVNVTATQSGTWTQVPGATTTGGATLFHLISAASTNATSVKGSAGQVYGYDIGNANAAIRYVKFYNKASAPTVGTDTPVKTVLVPASGRAQGTFLVGGVFGTGIAIATTTGIADTDSAAVGASDLSIDFDYK